MRLLVQVLIEPYRIQLAHSAVSQWRAILRQRGANGNSTGAVDAAKTTQMITLMTTKLQQRAVGCRFEYYDSAFQSFIPVEVSEYRYANREDADDDSADEELVHQFKLKRLKSLTSKWVELGIDNCRPLASVLSQEGACLVCPAPGTEAHEVLSQWGELRSELPPTGLVWMARALPTSQRAGRVVRVRSGWDGVYVLHVLCSRWPAFRNTSRSMLAAAYCFVVTTRPAARSTRNFAYVSEARQRDGRASQRLVMRL